MLTDPEKPSERWETEVWAENLETARTVCERIASRHLLTEVENVTQSSKTPTKFGEYKFLCWFKTEVDHDSSDN